MSKSNKNYVPKAYGNETNEYTAYPMGGIGAGMMCLEGNGMLSHISVRNSPKVFEEPMVFAALTVKGKSNKTLILEGQIQNHKIFRVPGGGNGLSGKNYGLPRFSECEFSAKFPFASIELYDKDFPAEVEICGWSPFIPNDADNSGLPVAALEYTIKNKSLHKIDTVFTFNSANFLDMNTDKKGKLKTSKLTNGFIFEYIPTEETKQHDYLAMCVTTDSNDAKVDCRWFRAGWFDPLSVLWDRIQKCELTDSAPYSENEQQSAGTSLVIPVSVKPKGEEKVKIFISWYAPVSDMKIGNGTDSSDCGCSDGSCCQPKTYKPYYAAKFNDINMINGYFRGMYNELKRRTENFTDALYESDLPKDIIEAIGANLTILKSPTVLRQHDGRLWAWEGCGDGSGCCHGSCTHVWNYAQAVAHLFPALERSLRETEFLQSQNDEGHQNFRSSLPIGKADHSFHAASDGQLGGIIKAYRDWRISGDDKWISEMLPKIKASLDYCIDKWDPERKGGLFEPHHNTYDIEFWGPDGMCGSVYAGALKAYTLMASHFGHETAEYELLYRKTKDYMENTLFNSEYFEQIIMSEGLKADVKSFLYSNSTPEGFELAKVEGPKYQYGKGCLADGIIGAWFAHMAGIDEILDNNKVESHLKSIYKYNLKKDLSKHSNPQRPGYAMGKEGGLLLCTWPKGGRQTLPFVYSDEVWTGIEYQVASHLGARGCIKECLDIVKTARGRYDGIKRNPFNEYECGHWYARALSSYGLIYSYTGIRYDKVEKKLYVKPNIKGDFECFISFDGGFGTAGVKDGKPFIKVIEGDIQVDGTEYVPFTD